MKKLAATLILLTSGFVFVACGGGNSNDSNEVVTTDNLTAAMDEVCAESDRRFADLGTYGMNNEGLAAEFNGLVEERQASLEDLQGLNLDENAQAEFDKYVAALEDAIAANQAVADAAEAGDDDAVNEAFKEMEAVFAKRDKVADEMGLEVCGQATEVEVEATGTAPPEDLEYAEPKDTVDDAAAAYLAAIKAGDCDAINDLWHTDAGEASPEICEAIETDFKGARLQGTEPYGPVGAAQYESADERYFLVNFAVDLDGEMRYIGEAIQSYGGLRPAPENNDADQTIEDLVAAIRDDDGKAFNATLPDQTGGFVLKEGDPVKNFSDGEFAQDFIGDVKSGDTEPVQLGINAAFAYYFLEGSEYDWAINLIHAPGSGAKYRFSGYFPLPKP